MNIWWGRCTIRFGGVRDAGTAICDKRDTGCTIPCYRDEGSTRLGWSGFEYFALPREGGSADKMVRGGAMA